METKITYQERYVKLRDLPPGTWFTHKQILHLFIELIDPALHDCGYKVFRASDKAIHYFSDEWLVIPVEIAEIIVKGGRT